MTTKPPSKNLADWNDRMFYKHPTPYSGFAGLVEKFRVRAIREYAKITPNDTVLELGCEAGNLLIALPESKKTVGFDISNNALKKARQKAKAAKRKIVFVNGDLGKRLPFKKGEFSVVICSETLEHVVDPQKSLKNIHKICGEDTRVIITVPNERPKLKIKEYLTRLKIMRLIMPGIEAEQSEWHLHAFSKEMLIKMMKKDFRLLKTGSILGLHVIVKAKAK